MNLTGGFLLGLLTGLAVTGDALLVLGTGLLGGYTTFSTWMFEAQRLGEDGEWSAMWLYLLGSMVAGLAATGAGMAARRGARMNADALKLSVYFGDAVVSGPRLAADALMSRFAARSVATAALLRGIEGFGINRRIHAQRFPDVSTDLPLLADGGR